ncbi:uncharacterized protein EI97DRAFT_162382 [Westerdykella ornata]|uniref:Uncharacterized protein n=1 Tax=Westerdykella ornata TaxID=318751 RepID=A0A6A6J9U2_WESOR|nr:uncharacterized protein EI97DRAFT_162382 [Westerdykella ornata]KAF2273360.1 hypothetical protein EI97DRAFT_162382 [Westerdykella ornata]
MKLLVLPESSIHNSALRFETVSCVQAALPDHSLLNQPRYLLDLAIRRSPARQRTGGSPSSTVHPIHCVTSQPTRARRDICHSTPIIAIQKYPLVCPFRSSAVPNMRPLTHQTLPLSANMKTALYGQPWTRQDPPLWRRTPAILSLAMRPAIYLSSLPRSPCEELIA